MTELQISVHNKEFGQTARLSSFYFLKVFVKNNTCALISHHSLCFWWRKFKHKNLLSLKDNTIVGSPGQQNAWTKLESVIIGSNSLKISGWCILTSGFCWTDGTSSHRTLNHCMTLSWRRSLHQQYLILVSLYQRRKSKSASHNRFRMVNFKNFLHLSNVSNL